MGTSNIEAICSISSFDHILQQRKTNISKLSIQYTSQWPQTWKLVKKAWDIFWHLDKWPRKNCIHPIKYLKHSPTMVRQLLITRRSTTYIKQRGTVTYIWRYEQNLFHGVWAKSENQVEILKGHSTVFKIWRRWVFEYSREVWGVRGHPWIQEGSSLQCFHVKGVLCFSHYLPPPHPHWGWGSPISSPTLLILRIHCGISSVPRKVRNTWWQWTDCTEDYQWIPHPSSKATNNFWHLNHKGYI